MKRIAVLTSGGDAPGMNAAIRAVVEKADYHGLEVVGVKEGYKGILERNYVPLSPSNTTQKELSQGGTFLYSARFPEFAKEEVQKQAVEILREDNIDALVVLGGDGSFRGALALTRLGFPAVGIPCTIDNDIPGTEYTIGFDTAVNTALDAIDKISDTANSHYRTMVVEVMGRDAGDIAVWSGLAAGASAVIIPEEDYSMQNVADRVKAGRKQGKAASIIVIAEGVASADEFVKEYVKYDEEADIRGITLAHLQRGGRPTARDRVYASLLGAKAVEYLLEGKTGIYLGLEHEHVIAIDILEGLNEEHVLKRPDLYQLSIDLSTPFEE